MKSNSVENIIADQLFKIQPMDAQIAEFLNDCYGTVENIKKQKSHSWGMAL